MKKLYCWLLLSLLGPAHLWAQTTDSLRLKLDYLFASLDKSQIPTGRLDAYATPLVPLAAFNGQLADSTRTTPAVFRALYATAYSTSIYGSNAMPTLPSYNATVAGSRASYHSRYGAAYHLRDGPPRCLQPKPADAAKPAGV